MQVLDGMLHSIWWNLLIAIYDEKFKHGEQRGESKHGFIDTKIRRVDPNS